MKPKLIHTTCEVQRNLTISGSVQAEEIKISIDLISIDLNSIDNTTMMSNEKILEVIQKKLKTIS